MGKDGMLAMWVGSSSGGDFQQGGDRTIYAQVLNRATGKAISSKVTVDKSVVGNRYQALKSVPVEGQDRHVGAGRGLLRLLEKQIVVSLFTGIKRVCKVKSYIDGK
ncbi:hypothetical protein PR003_g32097 [Phytophthora rubi]|uniref:Uncharacterized protein n=1 Tax=Phytophthora rubi TaxID=129364 RepID=A0A6A4B3P1_9STRA|nr:hypothetical protein PR003_g32097 [Phytophthora rubi]